MKNKLEMWKLKGPGLGGAFKALSYTNPVYLSQWTGNFIY